MMIRKQAALWLIVLLLLVAGCANESAATTSDTPKAANATEQQSAGQLAPPGKSGKISADKMKLTLYFPTKDAMYLQPEEVVMDYNDHPAKTAIELLIKGSQNKELVNVFPANTKLRGIKVKDKIAYVDFDNAILKNTRGGSSAENLLVTSIVNTLTGFEHIEKVQILVQGKVVDTIWGHMDVSEPLSRSEKMIKR